MSDVHDLLANETPTPAVNVVTTPVVPQSDYLSGDVDVPESAPEVKQFIEDVAQDVKQVVEDVKEKTLSKIPDQVVKDESQLAPLLQSVVKETKAGYKTSEFYVMLVGTILPQLTFLHLTALQSNHTVSSIVSAVAFGSYIVSRGLAKLGVGNQEVTKVK